MKVISISTDRGLFKEGSAVLSRSLEYAKRMDELHIVVFTLKKENHKLLKIGNLYLYPTNSLTQWLYVWNGLGLAKKVIAENKFIRGQSVISTHDPFQTGFVGARVAKAFNFPLQAQIHTDFLNEKFYRSFFNIIRIIIADFVIPKAQEIRVVSTVIRESLLKRYKNLKADIEVLPIFVDIEKIVHAPIKKDIRKDFSEFRFIIFMASRLAKEKRFDIALQALKKVVSNYKQAGLVIAGEGPEKSNIKMLAKKLGLEKNVKFVGWQDDLISYYKTCNIFLLTSEYEGYGMTLVEAGASAAMIVTTKVGIAKTDLFQDEVNCHVCPVGDIECIANCITSIIHDNQKRELFAHRLQDSIMRQAISADEYYSKYVELLSDLLSRK